VLRTLLVETEQKPSFLLDRFRIQLEVIFMTLTHQNVMLKETLFGHSCAVEHPSLKLMFAISNHVKYSISRLRYTYLFHNGQHIMSIFPWVYERS
jgi:hypothetical protein